MGKPKVETKQVSFTESELAVRAQVCNTSYGLARGKTPWYVDVLGERLVVAVDTELSPRAFKSLLAHLGHGDDYLRTWG